MFKGRHLVNNEDFSNEELLELVRFGEKIYENPQDYMEVCKGKVLGSLFFEPSTRTRLSFEAAMNRLGGRVISVPDGKASSASKGESVRDTITTVCCYADIICMRHPNEGAGELAREVSSVPFINAGDGGHQHPTQTLTDILTIYKNKQTLENLTIGLCGDLKFGRTVHSLTKTLMRFKGNEFIFISPIELKIPEYLKMELKKHEIKFTEVRSLDEVMSRLDILYMTRVQKERFFNEADYMRLKDTYILTLDKIKNAKDDMIILHPLPRVNEISVEVDSDKRAKYFEQAKYGMYIRMALIAKLLGVKDNA